MSGGKDGDKHATKTPARHKQGMLCLMARTLTPYNNLSVIPSINQSFSIKYWKVVNNAQINFPGAQSDDFKFLFF